MYSLATDNPGSGDVFAIQGHSTCKYLLLSYPLVQFETVRTCCREIIYSVLPASDLCVDKLYKTNEAELTSAMSVHNKNAFNTSVTLIKLTGIPQEKSKSNK